MLVMKLIVEGLGLGALLVLICAVGIKKGAVGMVHLYDKKVQDRVIQLGMATEEAIRKRSVRFRSLCLPAYVAYVLICVYAINGARGFLPGFQQALVILFVMHRRCRPAGRSMWATGIWAGWLSTSPAPYANALFPHPFMICTIRSQPALASFTIGITG